MKQDSWDFHKTPSRLTYNPSIELLSPMLWFWKKRVGKVCNKLYNEILAQNGEENDGEKTPWEERGGEQ